MFRALVWKEWRELALVRWGGIALGAILPIAFMSGGELARRGLLPTGSVTNYAPRDIMFELLPAALALGIWPLIGLMATAQAFAGNRAAGTEAFLLERPVPRTMVWRARLTATLLAVLVVMASTGALAAASAALVGAPPDIGWSRWVVLAVVGAGVALLAVLGSLVASSVISSPMGAVLLGAVLGSAPAALAAELMFFQFARIDRVPLGPVVSALLLPAYVAASWLALCRGEPAGRGRTRRAVTLLAAAFAGVLVLFVVLAPLAVRANAARGEYSVAASPSGATAFLSAGNDGPAGGWIVDVATGAKRAFVPPPVRDIAWAPSGTEVAVLTWSGPLGSLRNEERLDIRSTSDGSVLRSISLGDSAVAHATAWAEGGLVVVLSRMSSGRLDGAEVEIVDPGTGAWRATGFRWKGWPVDLVGPCSDGRVFLRVVVGAAPGEGADVDRGHRLFPIDVAAARVGTALTDSEDRPIVFAGWRDGLSPSGRFARVVSGERGSDEPRLVNLQGGTDQPSVIAPPWAVWAAGERLVWHDDLGHATRLFVATPGSPPQALREWRDAQVGIQSSLDGRALFVSAIPAGGAPATDGKRKPPDAALFEAAVTSGAAPEELVYLPGEDRFLTIGPPFSDRAHDHRYTQWAGPKTLARIGPGVVFFEDVESPGKRRFVVGGPGDLE